jgi:hypothetical protein
LTQPQSAEWLFGWQDGSQGREAKVKSQGAESRKKSELGKSTTYVEEYLHVKGPWPAFNKV